jgi:hypothetical protein
MIILASTDNLTASLAVAPATSNPFFYVSYFDTTAANGIVTYGDVASTQLTGTAPVTVIPPPPNATTARNLSGFMMVNTDTAVITLSLNLGGTPFATFKMSVGDNLSYSREMGEFRLLDSTGAVKQTVSMPNVAVTNGPNTFTGTQTFTGLIVPATALGIKGTAIADAAQAGSLGEVVTSTVVTGSSVSLTSVTSANVTSIILTAGDWDIDGSVCFTLASTTTMGYLSGGINTVSATMPLNNAGVATLVGAGTNAVTDVTVDPVVTMPRIRVNSANASTTVYLVARAKFGTSTCKAYGTIYARRVR